MTGPVQLGFQCLSFFFSLFAFSDIKGSPSETEHLPLLDHRQPAIQETCMYTMTPDGEPVIDRLPDVIIAGCGFSGSGFKHSPASGRMLAMLALGREEELPAGTKVLLVRPQGSQFRVLRNTHQALVD